ncbi:MAG: hypothetical protein ABSB49_05825 [Polyangia bacterium]|jgi:hypothetical protein
MVALSPDLITEWEGGSLGELVSTLQAAALPARIEVIPPGSADGRAGEIHLLAGGLADAFAGTLRRDEAVAALQRLEGARYVVVTCLPDPATGSLASPGPHEGSLKDRSVAALMRYCEEYVLTCRLEVWRGQERAVVDYRRGEIVGTSVAGSDASDRLPEVMAWSEGSYQIVLPAPTLPSSPRKSKAQVAEPALPDEWKRHPTLPAGPASDSALAQERARSIAVSAPQPAQPAVGASLAPAQAKAVAPPAEKVLPALTLRGSPPAPAVPASALPPAASPRPTAQPAPAKAATLPAAPTRPAVTPPAGQGKPAVTPAAGQAKPAATLPAAPPKPAVTPAAGLAKPAATPPAAPPKPAVTPAAGLAKPAATPPAAPPKPAVVIPVASAKPAPAASLASGEAGPGGVKTERPASSAPPPTVAPTPPFRLAPSPAGSTKKPPLSNDLRPASGTIEARAQHTNHLPATEPPVQIAQQATAAPRPDATEEAVRLAAAAPPTGLRRPVERKPAGEQSVKVYLLSGLAIGVGVVLAYWAYWYLPFLHH